MVNTRWLSIWFGIKKSIIEFVISESNFSLKQWGFPKPLIFFQLSGTADLFLNPSKASSAIFDYAIVYHERAFFIFGGGMKQGLKNTIARLDAKTATWSKVGILITGRRCHGARCSTLAPSLSGTPFFKGFEFWLRYQRWGVQLEHRAAPFTTARSF